MDYTLDSVEKLYAKGIINAKDRSLLRGKLFAEQNQFDGIHTKFINNLVEDVTKNWADLVVAVKETGQAFAAPAAGEKKKESDIFSLPPPAKVALQALSLLTFTPVITAGGRAAGQSLQEVLASHGVSNDIAAAAGALLGASAELRSGQAIAKATGMLPKAKQVAEWVSAEPAKMMAALNKIIPPSAATKAKAAVATNIKRAEAEADVFLRELGPKTGLEGMVEKDIAAEAQKKTTAAAQATAKQEAAAAAAQQMREEAAARALKSQEGTHDLLGKAMETIQPKELTPTQKTLEAAAATVRGTTMPPEVARNAAEIRATEAAFDNLLERYKKNPIGGGAPGYEEYVTAAKRSNALYEENLATLKAGKINIEDTINQAKMAGRVRQDIMEITPGQAVDPIEIAANSLVMKDHQREVYQLAQVAEEEWAKGNKQPFYQMLGEFNRLRQVDPNYRMPLQTAGQTLRIAGKPTVNVTRYQDEVVTTGSWLNGEKLGTVDQVEANALNIINRIKAMGDPDKVGNFAHVIGEHPEEILHDPTFRDYASFLFKNSIMSGTDTIGRNISGNMIAAPWHYAEKMTGIAASKVLDPFLSARHHVETGYASEANNFVTTWASSMWDASRYALTRKWDKLAEMVPEASRADLFASRYDLKTFATTGTTNPYGGLFGRIVGTPVSIAQAADEVSRVAIYRAAVSERLKHEWIQSGSKIPWGEYREIGFSNIAPDMHKYGLRMAGQMTFSDDPTIFGRLISNGRSMIENASAIPEWAKQTALLGSDWIMPFVRTTDRIMAYGYNRSPVLSALSSKTLKEFNSGDPLQRQEAIGRILLANIGGAGLFLAARGKAPDGETFITGGGPTNRTLAKSLRDAGVIHPYTMWTPAGRVPYHFLQPLAGPLGLIADTAEIFDELRQPDAEGMWGAILLSLSRNFVDTTFFQQGANVVNIFDNPSDQGNVNRLTRQMFASAVKGYLEPSIIRQALKAYDPTIKEAYDVWDELLRDVPGYGGPPKINPRTGQPVMNPPRLLTGTPFGWFLPTAPIQSEDDAVRNKFLELKMPFPDVPKAYGGGNPTQSSFAYSGPLGPAREAAAGIEYTADQKYKMRKYIHEPDETGQTADQAVKELIGDPEFNKLAPVVQQEEINAIYNGRIDRAVQRIAEEYPELDVQLEAKRQLRGELRMNPEDRINMDVIDFASPEPPEQVMPMPPIGLDNPSLEMPAEAAGPAEAAP